MKIEDKTFKKEDIHMDFNQFVNCTFEDCNMIYHGFGAVSMTRCSFNEVRWSFSDAASLTVNFMAGLYHGAGQGGRDLIKKIFDDIKNGLPLKK